MVAPLAPARLSAAYALSRELSRRHGRSYYLATRLLPRSRRPAVHALYGFTRRADDIVDATGSDPPADREGGLKAWGEAFRAGLSGAPVDDPMLPAMLDTVRRYGIDPEDVECFLASMAQDLAVTSYPTYPDLLTYMEGSAAVIGTMMLPVLGTVPAADPYVVRESARQLGFAFQLTNFIRDVGEDLDRGRVYLPETDLQRFGVEVSTLERDWRRRRASVDVRALIRYECRRALLHYRAALPGLELLEPRSRVCIRAATLLYGGILDEVRAAGYDVLCRRARVPRRRRLVLLMAARSRRTFDRRLAAWRATSS